MHRRHGPHHGQGDVANKIGTYLKALAAKDNGVPFYVALPAPTIDWTLEDGCGHPDRAARRRRGDRDERAAGRQVVTVRIAPPGSPAANYGFDVTPARLVTGLVTERGVCAASPEGLRSLFPERS